MLPGPVFNLELLTTARRPRYYAIRVLYGVAILGVIFLNYSAWQQKTQASFSANMMAKFALSTFGSFAAVQAVAVLAMTPALVAGVIVDEKQRKTLHYLLASRLTSGEIILGKLSARMLHVFVFLALGLPIVSLLSLFGGVDPRLVLLCDLVTTSTAFFLATMSILVSTSARRVRDAITAAYTLELGWLVGPSLIRSLIQMYWPETAFKLDAALSWLGATDPLGLVWKLGMLGTAGQNQFIEDVFWMVGLQVVFGSIMAWLAIVRLRPVFRAQADASPRRLFGLIGPKIKPRYLRFFTRRPVGDDAMMWKELHTSRGGGIRQIIETALLVLILGGLVVWGVYFAFHALIERIQNGYEMIMVPTEARMEFNVFLRITGAILGTLAALGTATAASNGMTMEREEDTWTALLTTPLDGREIVLAKMAGAAWRSRFLLATAIGLDLLGVVCGSVHPLGFLFYVVEVAVFMAFAVALGTSFSLRSRSSWRAQSLTLGIWMFANVGYGACCCPIASAMTFGGGGSSAGIFLAGCSPFLQGVALVSPGEIEKIVGPSGFIEPGLVASFAIACLIGTIGYGVAAFALTAATIAKFDDAVGRPRHGGVGFESIRKLASNPPGRSERELG